MPIRMLKAPIAVAENGAFCTAADAVFLTYAAVAGLIKNWLQKIKIAAQDAMELDNLEGISGMDISFGH